MKILAFLFIILANAYGATEFSFEKLIENPKDFHDQTLTVTGEIREVKLNTVNEEFTYWTFKLFPNKKGNHKNKFFGITIYNTAGGESIDNREFVENEEDIEVKGRFVRPFDEIEIHRKKLGEIYFNTKAYQDAFKTSKAEKVKVGSSIINEDKKFSDVSISDIASDFAEESGAMIKSTGYINDIKYTQLITGDVFFQIIIRDSMEQNKNKPFVLLKYYLYIQGIPVSQTDLSQYYYVGQKLDFKGEYKYIEKGENGALVGEVILNKFSSDGNYHDYFLGQ